MQCQMVPRWFPHGCHMVATWCGTMISPVGLYRRARQVQAKHRSERLAYVGVIGAAGAVTAHVGSRGTEDAERKTGHIGGDHRCLRHEVCSTASIVIGSVRGDGIDAHIAYRSVDSRDARSAVALVCRAQKGNEVRSCGGPWQGQVAGGDRLDQPHLCKVASGGDSSKTWEQVGEGRGELVGSGKRPPAGSDQLQLPPARRARLIACVLCPTLDVLRPMSSLLRPTGRTHCGFMPIGNQSREPRATAVASELFASSGSQYCRNTCRHRVYLRHP